MVLDEGMKGILLDFLQAVLFTTEMNGKGSFKTAIPNRNNFGRRERTREASFEF